MRVLVAMSGGVDSSVAAAVLKESGHDVVGATLKLWGGVSDSGCCSVADVADARRVADRLGIAHHVFNFTEAFDRHVVSPYAASHAAGETPNPCVECNRHLKFDALLLRARRLGFDAIATGHHARIEHGEGRGAPELHRGADVDKDQSYVLAILRRAQLDSVLLPIGEMDKPEVRARAAALGLVTANKPDSQDVCFITSHQQSAGRAAFLRERIDLHRARVLDESGAELGEVDAIELMTVGQRRGLPPSPKGSPRFVVALDMNARTVTIGSQKELLTSEIVLKERTWTDKALAPGTEVLVQSSAHGAPRKAVLTTSGVVYSEPARRVAPGQLVALYDGDRVVGSGVATR